MDCGALLGALVVIKLIQLGQIGKSVLLLSCGPNSCDQDHIYDIAENCENYGNIYNHLSTTLKM